MRLTFTPRNIFACTAAMALGLTTVAPGQDDPIQDRLSPGVNASADADADTGESFEDNGTQTNANANADADADVNTDTGANADADADIEADVRANNQRNRGDNDGNRDGRNRGDNDRDRDGRNQRPGDDDRFDRGRDGRRDRDDDRRGDRDRDRRGDWVRFGADFDGDGQVDGWEEFYYDDYEELRRRSRDRARRDGRRPFRGDYSARRPGFGPDNRRNMDRRAHQRRETLRGEIRDIRYDTLNGVEGECMIARVRTEDGRTARVCLGPRTQLRRLDLSDGDRITVYGHPGHINDRAMFFASQVSYDGTQLQVNMPKAPSLKRVRGEIVSTRKAKFRGISERHVLADVELVSGREETMNLGPESKIRRLNLRDGDEISALVRPGRVNGEFAMIAEQVRHDGQTVELPRPQDRSRFGNSDRSQSSNRTRPGNTRSRFDDSRSRYNARRPNYDSRSQYEAGRQNDDRNEFQGPNPAARNDARIDGDISAGLGILLRHTDDQGVEIVRVVPNSPAANADLKKGDTLVSIDGQPVSTYQDVTRILKDFDANDRVTVRVRRNDRLRAASVRLSPRSDLFDEQN